MNKEISNAMFGYLETLYNINKNLIELCGIDAVDDFESGEKKILDIIQDIPRIVPYSYNKYKQKLEYKRKDGLLEYQDNILYLKNDYDKILLENYEFLDKIRKIRNKYEHKMHGAKYRSSGNGTLCLFIYVFKIENELIEIKAKSLIKLIKSINKLFSNIVHDIKIYAYENGKDNYLYYIRITRFNFIDFNKIYDDELLKIIGKIMSIKNF